MNKLLLIFILAFLSLQTNAQTYEGTINNDLNVWFDLTLPPSDGQVSGSYFYVKVGRDIKLSGTKKGNSISLNEYGDGQKITGIINCDIRKDSICGTWKKPNGKKALPVALIRTNPDLRKYVKMLNGQDLKLLDGSSLAEQLKSCSGEGYTDEDGNPTKSAPALSVSYERDDILSVSFSWAYMGAYPSYGTTYHTFDLTTNTELQLWDQIDERKMADFNRLLCTEIQPELIEAREQYSDSEWEEVFSPGEGEKAAKDSVGEHFRCKDVREGAPNGEIGNGVNYYLEGDSLHFVLDHYFGFPHVIQALDLFGDVSIPLEEFKKCLKKESPFRRISAIRNRK